MKNYKYILIAACMIFFFSSCTKEELASSVDKEFMFLNVENAELFFERGTGAETPNAGIRVVLHANNRDVETNYSFEILESSTAIEGVHYSVESNSGVVPANTVIDTLGISIIPDNLVPCESISLHVRLTGSDIERTDTGTLELSLNLESSSELAGIVNYVHTDNFVGEDITGQVEIMALENPGEYFLSDFSFGSWEAAYGSEPPTGTLRWNNNCSTIRLSGTDNYGDVWQMDEIISSGGPEFSFTWSNTYGEYGKVSIMRQDGKDWPELEL